MLWLVCAINAAASDNANEKNSCEIKIGQPEEALQLNGFERLLRGPVIFSDVPGKPSVLAHRVELRVTKKCNWIAETPEGDPNVIIEALDKVPNTVVLVSYRPAVSDCKILLNLFSVVFRGLPSIPDRSGDAVEWTIVNSGIRIYLDSNESGCWVSTIKIGIAG
jgi:hypothetical protein